MEKEKLKKILDKYYLKEMVKSILSGRRRPNYETMCKLYEEEEISFLAWRNIEEFLKQKDKETTA